jgi:protein ATS1
MLSDGSADAVSMPPTHHLYAFGSNGESQLGLGYASDKVTIPTLINVPQSLDDGLKVLRGGGNHTLVLTTSSQIWGAGSNQNQQLGYRKDCNVAEEHSSRIIKFQELHSGVSFCAAAWESSAYVLGHLAASSSGESSLIYTEGRARHGELGRGPDCNSFPGQDVRPIVPDDRQLDTLSTVLPGKAVAFAAGMYHYVAVLETGDVYGWGRARNGQLGRTDQKCHWTPTRIRDVPFKAQNVVCGQYFTYIVGDPESGEHMVLGDDKHGVQSKKPDRVKGWKDIGATWNAVFVLFEDGSLAAWGKSDLWQLVPPGLPELEQIAVGSDHILTLTADNRVLSWGWAVHGNCGGTTNLKMPLDKGYVTGQYNDIEFDGGVVIKVATGYSTSFILATETE